MTESIVEASDIDAMASACAEHLSSLGGDPVAKIAKCLRAALSAHAAPMRDVLQDIASDYAGAPEGSEDEAKLDKIGAVIDAFDTALASGKT